jgi:hypothetical protein
VSSAERTDALMSGIASRRMENAAILEDFEHERSVAQARTLPGFVVLGPPRTGTTWLYDVLNSRALLPCPTKETRFFDLHFERGIDWYLDHFPKNPQKLAVGEIAPTYFASPEACARILSVVPDARLVIIFRNPVQRLVSLYRLKRAYGLHAWSFEEALQNDPELLGSSLYASHLKMWQSSFAEEQLSINFFEDLTANPQGFVDRICRFVGIPEFTLKESERKQVFSSTKMTEPRNFVATRTALAVADWCKARKLDRLVQHVRNSQVFKLLIGGGAPFTPLPGEVLERVHDRLLPEVEELERLTGRDLTAWKSPPKS